MILRPAGIPKGRIYAGEDSKVMVWILTPTGTTTPNSIHVWMDDKIWEDTWIWTEEPVAYRMPLTRYGVPVTGTIYRWDDTQLWKDNLVWTENT
jgi:hypothetical protein